MSNITALWAVPRSTSTAFEWMMRQRGDLNCFHEPFGEAWYQGENPLWPRVTDESVRTPGLTLEGVLDKLLSDAREGPIFTKDFPHYVAHIWDSKFLEYFNHSFLIRDPAKTITSMFKHWPDFHMIEAGFIEQRQLFDLVSDHLGSPPPVLDSDDLLEDPYKLIQLWCKSVNLPFIESALRWEPGARDEVSWWDGGSFHENLRNSNGLKPQERHYININEAPDNVKKIYDIALPHYEHLYQYRLGIDNEN